MESFRTFSSLELVRANACNRFVCIVHSSGMRQHQIAHWMRNRIPLGCILLCDICRHFASVMLHFASLHYIFSAHLSTHIKFLTEFHRIFFGTTCISFPFFSWCCVNLLLNCSRTEIFLKNSFLILNNVWVAGRLAHCFFVAVLACEKVFGVSGWAPAVCENLWKFVWIFPVKYFVSSANSSTFATAKGETTLADAPTEPTAEKSFQKKAWKFAQFKKWS